MIDRDAAWVANAAGARLAAGDPAAGGPERAVVDSRAAGPGDLFAGIRGEHADGGSFAAAALAAGAWGVLVSPAHEGEAVEAARGPAVLVAGDPLTALQSLAREWRRALGCKVVGITGSTGKTSTKDILAALLRPGLATHANRENLNTEVGLPLSVLESSPGTQALVLEMAMRGEGQIAELTAIAEPDVGVIVNVGPVHLALLRTVERVAAAKAELIRDLPSGAACVVPARERLLAEHLRADLDTITFGPGGDVALLAFNDGVAEIEARGEQVEIELPYDEPYNLLNTLAAVAAAHALGVRPAGAVEVEFSSLRGEVVELPGAVTVVNDCYNANPMSMRSALDHLAASRAERRVAVLGTMAELGSDSSAYHREIGELAARLGIDLLVTVGDDALDYAEGFGGETRSVATPEEAAALLEEVALPGDRVLVKGSRSAGLERVLA
jgi:UDP-N-acetylmuramoyl-tripeptide--D-alanyl-D-alanine ligase